MKTFHRIALIAGASRIPSFAYTARKPLHELRKELGSLVTAEYGIYAASRVLRHSTVATTAAHYTDLKTRPTIAVGAWLKPENVVSNVGHTTRGSLSLPREQTR